MFVLIVFVVISRVRKYIYSSTVVSLTRFLWSIVFQVENIMNLEIYCQTLNSNDVKSILTMQQKTKEEKKENANKLCKDSQVKFVQWS